VNRFIKIGWEDEYSRLAQTVFGFIRIFMQPTASRSFPQTSTGCLPLQGPVSHSKMNKASPISKTQQLKHSGNPELAWGQTQNTKQNKPGTSNQQQVNQPLFEGSIFD